MSFISREDEENKRALLSLTGEDTTESRDGKRTKKENDVIPDTVMALDDFYLETAYSRRRPKTFRRKFKKRLRACNVKAGLYSLVPVAEWIQSYRLPDLVADLITGVTLAILSVPQSIAYALLANVPAKVGMYMAFFPPLIYFLFGSSKQNNIGTFAIICLMTGKVVLRYTEPNTEAADTPNTKHYSSIEVGTSLAFVIGLYQISMYVFRLGLVSKFLSEHLIAGFTTASACHVYITQIPELLGLTLPKRIGYFKIVYFTRDCIENIHQVNVFCISLSLISITLLMFSIWVIKPWMAKRTIFPLPSELILVVITTIASQLANFKDTYNIRIVGDIPTGLPKFQFPNFGLMSELVVDAFSISIVSYALTVSVALMLGSKHFYQIDCSQEALALGLTNMITSCFQCIPSCTSLSRSLVQEAVGGRTQFASVFSSACTLIVLLKLGTYLQPLPKATLAVIIVVALRNAILQILKLRTYWRISKLDTILFITTFVCVLFIDIDIGLLIGFSMSLLVILYQGLKPYVCLLGQIPRTDIYLNIRAHKQAREIPRIKIFHYGGGLCFAQTDTFREELFRLLDCDPLKVARARRKELQARGIKVTFTKLTTVDASFEYMDSQCIIPFQVVIWDFSGISYIDSSGVKQCAVIAKYFKNLNITVLLASPSDPVFETLRKCDENAHYAMYPTIHDAVEVAKLITHRQLGSY